MSSSRISGFVTLPNREPEARTNRRALPPEGDVVARLLYLANWSSASVGFGMRAWMAASAFRSARCLPADSAR
jgi:hypothetical protein